MFCQAFCSHRRLLPNFSHNWELYRVLVYLYLADHRALRAHATPETIEGWTCLTFITYSQFRTAGGIFGTIDQAYVPYIYCSCCQDLTFLPTFRRMIKIFSNVAILNYCDVLMDQLSRSSNTVRQTTSLDKCLMLSVQWMLIIMIYVCYEVSSVVS